MKTLSKKIWKRWTVNARFLETGEPVYDGSTTSYFLRSSAEKECRTLNAIRLLRGYRDWTYYVHDRKQ